MNVPRYRAFRFAHPDLDPIETVAGFQVSPSGRLEMIDEDRTVRQAILLLISTTPGERVMRPDYGCLLQRLVFSPNDDTTAGLAIHYVRRAVVRWEPRVEIIRVDASRDPEDPACLDILLEYRVRSTQRAGRLTFPLNLVGGPG